MNFGSLLGSGYVFSGKGVPCILLNGELFQHPNDQNEVKYIEVCDETMYQHCSCSSKKGIQIKLFKEYLANLN